MTDPDPFGIKENPKLDAESQTQAPSRRRLWAVLLVLDTILVCVFGGALVGMLVLNGNPPDLLRGLLEPPAPVRAVPRHNPQSKPAPPAPPAPPPAQAPVSPPPPPAPSTSNESQLQEPQKAKRVEFVCAAKNAKRVYLKGPFLKSGRKRMKKGSDGSWRLSNIYLIPGTYKYSCSVNGKDSEPMTMDVP